MTDPYELTDIPKLEEIESAYQAKRPLVFKWLMPPNGEETVESQVLMVKIGPSPDSDDVLLIAGRDLNVKQGPSEVGLRIDLRANTGGIVYY